MVVKKRVDYGFLGYRVPSIPRGPRSVRSRGSRKKSVEDSQVCAFELLAAVAGKLLQESESSASSNAEGKDQHHSPGECIKHEEFEEDKAFRSECLDQGSCVESVFMPDSVAREQNSKSTMEEIPLIGNDSVLERTSIVTTSDFSKDINLDLKLEIFTSSGAERDLPEKAKGGSSGDENLCDGKIKNGADGQVEDNKKQATEFLAANAGSIKDPINNCVNNNTRINSESSVQLQMPLYRDPVHVAFARHRNNVKLGIIRDDDDNSFGCNSTKIKAFRPQSRFGYRRIRKILTSKYWKVAPKLKDSELFNCYEGMKPFYRSRKRLGSRERCQREASLKRRKICERNFVVACDQEASSESISNSPEKGVRGENSGSAALMHRAVGSSNSVKGLHRPRDANVKLSIKSFKVPELYIEVPETATVGSLKRTVMEAVTTILGGGLRVGVVLQGKKVRDDNRTLQQAGISDSSNLETLGFTLEPGLNLVAPVSPKKPLALRPNDADQRLLRSPLTPNLELGLPVPCSSNDPPVSKMAKPVESKLELELLPRSVAETCIDQAVEDSKALVPISSLNMEALAVVPVNQKLKRSELSQRRTRRPFSVAEVEALVEAVEKLGTGRWRDVKMRAFDNADHRTYVDLKDKWKTLVHTASISPQQRRGEPVPQELLDRVLSAHAYWSQHQSKQHGKHQVEEALRITDCQLERVGA